MRQSDHSGDAGDDAPGGTVRGDATSGTAHEDGTGATTRALAESGREYVPQPPRTVRWGIDSGAAAAVGAGAALVSGFRALRRGDGQSAFTRLLAGGVLGIVAITQRRSTRGRERDRSDVEGSDRSDVEETDVVDTSPDVEDAATAGDAQGPKAQRATGEEASEVVDTGPDVGVVEDAEPESAGETDVGESEADVHEIDIDAGDSGPGVEASESDTREPAHSGGGTEEPAGGSATPSDADYERLGGAAFDEQSGRVPAPQEAFNLELLSSGAEAFWGVHESDEALVVVSIEFDSIEDTGEYRYVASSEVNDDDRKVRVPDTVLDHWDDAAGGGTAVTSGTDLVFLITDELQEEGLLVVVPEEWSDELLEESEE